jgi:CRISPR system Cascade subunit CasD
MGVRVDREGTVKEDFHTAQDVVKADHTGRDNQISSRAYLEDAAFLVGLEGDRYLLKIIADHLKKPVWPIFLGRKAFVPSLPLLPVKSPEECLFDEPLESVLKSHPLVVPYSKRLDEKRDAMRLVLECKTGESGERRQDVPVSFDFDKRSFRCRYVSVSWIPVPREKED